jgi:protein-S-isoprenylcysteine O-methyltransferase Ste14
MAKGPGNLLESPIFGGIMIYLAEQSKSIIYKAIFSLAVILTSTYVGISYALSGKALSPHALVFMGLLGIYLARLQVTVWVFQKRKWTFAETLMISCVMPLAIYCFYAWDRASPRANLALSIVAIALYAIGSFINTYSELTRHRWKKLYKGHLYTGGLFKYAMHINYLGDILLFMGFALFTNQVSALVIPLIMALNFLLFIIPTLDAYLGIKYGEEFRQYNERTKKLIPFIY